MQRVKKIDYDDDDVYSDEEGGYDGQEAGYTAEDRENFATLTPVVRAELQDAGLHATDGEIEEALWHYYWDVGKSVAYLKNTRTPRPQQQQSTKKAKPQSKFDQAAQRSAENAASTKAQAQTDELAKQTETLKGRPSLPTPVQPKIKSKGLDVPKLWQSESSKRKSSMAFVVIGHVDHGKSTLMGRLLLETGAVSQRDIDKYKKQATELGKASFALAWVMDTGSEERERGVTVDIAQFHFSTSKVDFTILDAPGHRDFVPNMIAGASMADVTVLVIDANQLESGMKGQTREHVLLAKACGLNKIIVAVNKLDATTPPWNANVFHSVRESVSRFLATAGFSHGNVVFIPCSGLSGQNVVKPAGITAPWVAGDHQSLLQALEAAVIPSTAEDAVKRPFRMQIADVFRGGITNPLSVSGHISAGYVQIGESVMIQPGGETASIKGIEVAGNNKDWTVAGQICTLHLTEVDQQHLRTGDLLCSVQHPAVVSKSFIAQLQALESLLPQAVDVHVGRLHASGMIAALISTLDANGEVLRKKPRIVKAGQKTNVKLILDEGAALEMGDIVILRASGSTVAAGKIARVGG